MSRIHYDIRYALRALGKRPGFTAAAVLTLALGIGANTALFSVVKSVLLEPLPYHEPDRVAMVWSQWTEFPKTWVSIPEYHQYRTQLQSFSDLALFQSFEVNVTEGEAERIRASTVTPNMMSVLGVAPVLGRDFTADDGVEGRDDVVMISHGLWQARYAGDPDIAGETISINGTPQTVIGVLPPGFRLPLDFARADPSQVFAPLVLPADTGAVPHSGGSHSYFAIGRLRVGVTADIANAELDAHVQRLAGEGVYGPDMQFRAFAVTAPDEVAGALRPALMVLLGAVALVLLIACANVAGLTLARGEERRHELGVRAALGAGRGRIVRQLLTESFLLGAAGALAGVSLAFLCVELLASTAYAGLPRLADAAIDLPVLMFAIAVAFAAALLSGLIPAIQGARTDPRDTLHDGGHGRTTGTTRGLVRRGIVAAQVALAVILVTGAGLTLRGFWNLVEVDPGLDPENVLTMRLAPNAAYFPDDAAVSGFYGEFLRRVRGIAGVEHAGLILRLPIDTDMGDTGLEIEGYTPPPHRSAPAEWQAASPGYFEAMSIPVVEGRAFTDGDDAESPLAIIVNEAFVRAYVPDGNALGKRVRFSFQDDLPWQTIVGVVGDVRHNGLTGDVKPGFYRPHAQWAVPLGNPLRSMTLVVRAPGRDLQTLASEIRGELRALDTRVPVSRVQTMNEVMSVETAQPRMLLQLLGAFAVLAIALAAIGIYGVVSYLVAARRREIGVRIALGATRGNVVRLSLRQGLTSAVLGAVIGVAAAALGTRALTGLLYGVDAANPAAFMASVALLAAVALVASWLPARRAARIDPMQALREE